MQTSLFEHNSNLINLKEASEWASQFTGKNISVSNISYLLQYGRIRKFSNNSRVLIDLSELKEYFENNSFEHISKQEKKNGINWHLSFNQYKESERTKHVHRIHPYKGKFIPQLVEYFLDQHKDAFKNQSFFKPNDIVLDPFCGSGTTLVQANELGINAIGLDISEFNVLISNVKVREHNFPLLEEVLNDLTNKLLEYIHKKNNVIFDENLQNELSKFNNQFFPSPEYKIKIREGKINEKEYSDLQEKKFNEIYSNLIIKYNIQIKNDNDKTFLNQWFVKPVVNEIQFLAYLIDKVKDKDIRDVVSVILSRTTRSCRATTHADLGTLKKPVFQPYYCKKHGKICKPVFSIKDWWLIYSKDTIKRLKEFHKIRTNTYQLSLVGDSRKIDLFDTIYKIDKNIFDLLKTKKIDGIFTSPPYVGLIDYHEQHAYSYEILGLKRYDELEIGSLRKGQNKNAQKKYVDDIASVLINSKKYLKDEANIFLVANDKYNLYPQIAEKSGLKIINTYKRPVLNRVEKDRDNLYLETIFHLITTYNEIKK